MSLWWFRTEWQCAHCGDRCPHGGESLRGFAHLQQAPERSGERLRQSPQLGFEGGPRARRDDRAS